MRIAIPFPEAGLPVNRDAFGGDAASEAAGLKGSALQSHLDCTYDSADQFNDDDWDQVEEYSESQSERKRRAQSARSSKTTKSTFTVFYVGLASGILLVAVISAGVTLWATGTFSNTTAPAAPLACIAHYAPNGKASASV